MLSWEDDEFAQAVTTFIEAHKALAQARIARGFYLVVVPASSGTQPRFGRGAGRQRKGRGKGKRKMDITKEERTLAMEYAGVGFVIKNHLLKTVLDYDQISGRNIKLTLNSHSNPVHILSTYAPQSGVGQEET